MMEWLTLKMRARRPIKRPQLTLRLRHARFDWSHDHLGWTIRTWRRVHWSDERRFLLRPTDGRAMELSEQPLAVKNVVQFGFYVT
jgi:hypothetical protein